MRIRARKMTKGSLLKILFIGHAITLIPFTLVCGIASAFGAHTITVNDKYLTSSEGLIASLLLGPLFCLLFTVAGWLIFAIGLWMYSLFSPIELEFIDAEVISSQPVSNPQDTQQIESGTL